MTEFEVAEDIKQKEEQEQEEERKLLAARDLGQAVKQRLKELRWVQQDLAEELNTSQSVISAIIAGNYLLTFDLVTRLAKALKLPPLKLASFYWKDEEQEILINNNEVIERVRELLTEYYQIGGHQQLSDQSHPISEHDKSRIEKYTSPKKKVKREKDSEPGTDNLGI
jgi:transcriptional regulator with XRE-family HTH domain